MSLQFQDVETYLSQRSAFIQADRALRRENGRLGVLTQKEKQGDAIIRQIRKDEESSVWAKDYDGIPHPFPGMEFLTGKYIIDQTRLFRIVQKMPKGALLHAHFDATVNSKWLLERALQYPQIHVRSPAQVTSTSIGSLLPEFCPRPHSTVLLSPESGNLTSSAYTPGGWVPLAHARQTFSSEMGGPEGFDKWALDSMMINPAEAYGTHNTVTKIWKKFLSTFSVASPLVLFRPIFVQYIRQFLLSSIEDGISYVEPRINFYDRVMCDENGQANVPHREWLLDFDRVLKELKEEMKDQGREDEFIGAKIIYTTVRVVSAEELEWYTEDCINLKQEFPHLIAGFDLVGDENVCKPLTEYIMPLLAFKKRVKELGLDIPLLLHAGETLGDGTKADDNLYDAILLGTKRIGHGFSIVKHPKLMKICREKGIALEVCPISNEILRLTSSMPMHPLPILLNHGVPIALNSDDPAIFGYMGLSYDFFQVIASSEVTGLLTLAQIARDSITFSTLDPSEKARALALWEKRWDEYLDKIISQDI